MICATCGSSRCFVILIRGASSTVEGRSGNSDSATKVGLILAARVLLMVTIRLAGLFSGSQDIWFLLAFPSVATIRA